MNKRILAILLVVSMLATLTACGNTDTETNNEMETTESSESVVESTQTEITEAEEPKEEESVESTEIETVESEDTETLEMESIEAVSESESVVEESAPQYTYTDLSKTMYAQLSVNVRDLPSTDGNKIGSLKTNDEVSVTGQCNETGWYRIAYSDGEAYVSNKYLGDNKVEIQQPAQTIQTSDNSGNNASGENTDTVTSSNSDVCPVDLNAMWYDASEECVYYYWYDENGNGLMDESEDKTSEAHNLLEQSTGIKWYGEICGVDTLTWNGKQLEFLKFVFQEEGKPAPGEDLVWW